MNDTDTVDFGKEIIPQNIDKLKIQSYQFEGYWTDIGNVDSFFEANLELTDNIPAFNLFDKKLPIFTRPRMLPTSKISGTAHGSYCHRQTVASLQLQKLKDLL